MDPHKFHGKDIPHIKLDPKMNIEDLVEVFANSGFNGRQLGEAAKLYEKSLTKIIRSYSMQNCSKKIFSKEDFVS